MREAESKLHLIFYLLTVVSYICDLSTIIASVQTSAYKYSYIYNYTHILDKIDAQNKMNNIKLADTVRLTNDNQIKFEIKFQR